MLIFGFDPSKCTGYAVYDLSKHRSAIQCGVFEMPDKADHYYTGDQIGLKTTALIRTHGTPDFVAMEEQSKAQIGGSNADALIYAWGASLAIAATLANFNIPYGTIPVGTWHKMYYGSGFQPPMKKVKLRQPNKDGETHRFVKDWKAAAVNQCDEMGIVLPSKKTVAHNAAEAVALAICWPAAKLHAGRYQKKFMELRLSHNDRARVAA